MVSCYLPCYRQTAKEKVGAEVTAQQQNSTSPPPYRVLIIEKDTQLQLVGKAMLEYLDHDVTAVSGLTIIAAGKWVFDSVVESYHQYGFVNALPEPLTMDSLRHVVLTASDGISS